MFHQNWPTSMHFMPHVEPMIMSSNWAFWAWSAMFSSFSNLTDWIREDQLAIVPQHTHGRISYMRFQHSSYLCLIVWACSITWFHVTSFNQHSAASFINVMHQSGVTRPHSYWSLQCQSWVWSLVGVCTRVSHDRSWLIMVKYDWCMCYASNGVFVRWITLVISHWQGTLIVHWHVDGVMWLVRPQSPLLIGVFCKHDVSPLHVALQRTRATCV